MQQRILRPSQKDISWRQLNHPSLVRANRHLASRHSHLTSNVTESNGLHTLRVQCGNAGDFADVFFVRNNLVPRRDRRRSLHNEAGKLAMYIAARANALHTFLSHLSPLVEVDRPHLFTSLGQASLPTIHPL